ncbi:thioesterase family protein [Marivirga sp.]|uniref:thioesterase family protein n=1 Tax=Marivirga sp. TaxID=2018662 RepID=UPI003DA6E684
MKDVFKNGDRKSHFFKVKPKDVAHFEQQAVHDVCATFTLARELEWATRLFVLEMLEDGEEGIGTHLNIQHLSPAILGETVEIEAVYVGIKEREIICEYVAKVEKRLIAKGTTGQKILQKEKLTKIFEQLSK